MSDKPVITRDAERLLSRLYALYVRRRRDGRPEQTARYIGDTYDVIRLLSLDMDEEKVTDLLLELGHSDYLDVLCADDIANECTLTSYAIATMENRLKDGVKDFVDLAAKLI